MLFLFQLSLFAFVALSLVLIVGVPVAFASPDGWASSKNIVFSGATAWIFANVFHGAITPTRVLTIIAYSGAIGAFITAFPYAFLRSYLARKAGIPIVYGDWYDDDEYDENDFDSFANKNHVEDTDDEFDLNNSNMLPPNEFTF